MRQILLRCSIFLVACLIGIGVSSLFRREALPLSAVETLDSGTIPQVRNAAFVGKDKAWLVTWESYGDLWQTDDGGTSWKKVSGKAVGGVFCGISFIDANRGWAGNFDGQIFRTTDGGATWELLSKPLGDD